MKMPIYRSTVRLSKPAASPSALAFDIPPGTHSRCPSTFKAVEMSSFSSGDIVLPNTMEISSATSFSRSQSS